MSTRTADIPAEITHVLGRTLIAELSTLARNGRPVTWPMVPLWKPDPPQVVMSTGIALPNKIYRIQRDDRVSVLFSDRTGSGLPHTAPAVLVQGRAMAPDEIQSVDDLADFWAELFRKQPMSRDEALDPQARGATPNGYYWRVRITVTPERVWAFRPDSMGGRILERVA
jgi:hypothetical protein